METTSTGERIFEQNEEGGEGANSEKVEGSDERRLKVQGFRSSTRGAGWAQDWYQFSPTWIVKSGLTELTQAEGDRAGLWAQSLSHFTLPSTP